MIKLNQISNAMVSSKRNATLDIGIRVKHVHQVWISSPSAKTLPEAICSIPSSAEHHKGRYYVQLMLKHKDQHDMQKNVVATSSPPPIPPPGTAAKALLNKKLQLRKWRNLKLRLPTPNLLHLNI